MTVFLTSPVLGQDAGTAYTGPLESWLLHEGYARADADSLTDAITVTPTAATLAGTVNAVNIVTGGNLVLATKDGVRTTIALAAADTPAAAATKIDTALAGLADASIVSSKLNVVSNATGPTAYVFVVSGTGTVLANLGLAVGQVAYGGDGRPTGASNTGVQADIPANHPGEAANREAPYFPSTPDRHTTIANDAAHLTLAKLAAPGFDMDVAAVDAEAPSNLQVIEPQSAGVTKAKVVGSAAAVSVVTGGNLVLSIDGATNITVALATSDTPAAAVTKINTGLGTQGTASLSGGVLQIESATKGLNSTVRIVSGTGTVLADLKLTAGQVGNGDAAILKAAGGDIVHITGTNLENVTGVTFGGTAGTSLDVTKAADGVITVVAPPKAAGSYDIVVTDNIGSATITGGATYA